MALCGQSCLSVLCCAKSSSALSPTFAPRLLHVSLFRHFLVLVQFTFCFSNFFCICFDAAAAVVVVTPTILPHSQTLPYFLTITATLLASSSASDRVAASAYTCCEKRGGGISACCCCHGGGRAQGEKKRGRGGVNLHGRHSRCHWRARRTLRWYTS